MKSTVYGAGPITGLDFEAANSWRLKMRLALAPDIEFINPLRGKDHLASEATLSDGYLGDALSTDQAIFERDYFDVQRADMVLVNFLGATRISQGTLYEIAWTKLLQKPLLVIMEDQGNVHEHLFLRACTSFRVSNLPDACEVIRRVLLPN